MATNYPGALDSFTNPTSTDTLNSATVPHADQHANANDAIEAIQATLGINPQGGSATVVARLNSIGASQGTGFNYLFSSSTSMTDPGAGKFALNNSNLTLATQIAISTTNNASVVVSGWLDKWTVSSNPTKSVITISSKTDANVFAIYQVAAVSVQSGFYVFTISPVTFNGTFANLADCFVANVQIGDKGNIGDFDGYGFGWAFSSNTNTATAPSNGTFKLNNANSASATQIAISKVNSEGGTVNISWFSDLATTNNNRIIIREKTLPGTYIAYSINYATLTDYGTWVTFDINIVTRNGSITNGDPCWIVATLAGNDGATGPTGPGVPTAGNTGDLLIKTGSGNYQTGWTTPSNTPANGIIPLYASSSYGSAGLRVGQGGIGIASQGTGNIQTILGSGATGTFTLPSNANSILAATTDRTAGITGNQAINTVYAAPASGSAGLANFRSLVANDIPTLDQSKLDGVSVSTWAPNTSYTKGDLASYNGITYRRVSTSSSGTTFNTANWQQITPLNTFAGHAQLNSSRTLANNTTCNPVFVDNSGTVVYLNLEPDKTYFFEGWIQNTTATTTTSKNPLISFYYIDELGNGLTPQSFSMVVNTFTSGVTYNAAGTSSVNTDLVINGTTATAGTYYSSYRGFIRTASTTTNSHRINIGIGQSSATGAATGVIAASRSYINVTDMGAGLNAITGYWS